MKYRYYYLKIGPLLKYNFAKQIFMSNMSDPVSDPDPDWPVVDANPDSDLQNDVDLPGSVFTRLYFTVLGIRDILVRNRILIRTPGSLPLINGSGSGSNSGSDSFVH